MTIVDIFVALFLLLLLSILTAFAAMLWCLVIQIWKDLR